MARPARVDVVSHEEDLQELMTGEAVALDLRPTSFVLRAAGSIIDYLVYLGGYIGLMVFVLTFALCYRWFWPPSTKRGFEVIASDGK